MYFNGATKNKDLKLVISGHNHVMQNEMAILFLYIKITLSLREDSHSTDATCAGQTTNILLMLIRLFANDKEHMLKK